jgi:hypothetical protein
MSTTKAAWGHHVLVRGLHQRTGQDTTCERPYGWTGQIRTRLRQFGTQAFAKLRHAHLKEGIAVHRARLGELAVIRGREFHDGLGRRGASSQSEAGDLRGGDREQEDSVIEGSVVENDEDVRFR